MDNLLLRMRMRSDTLLNMKKQKEKNKLVRTYWLVGSQDKKRVERFAKQTGVSASTAIREIISNWFEPI